MKYIYAALLLHSAHKPVDEDNITKIFSAVGVEADKVRVKALVAALSEIKIDEALKSASTLTAAPAPQVSAPAEPKEEKPKEEKKKEEEALAGLGALFG